MKLKSKLKSFKSYKLSTLKFDDAIDFQGASITSDKGSFQIQKVLEYWYA